MTGTRPRACSTVSSITRLCSSPVSVATSPVVPQGTKAVLPSAICHSTSSRYVSSATRPRTKGVTSAGMDPKNMNLSPFRDVPKYSGAWLRSPADKDRYRKMSSMRRAAFLLPVLVMAASGSAQVPLQQSYRPAYPVLSNDIDWAIADWRRLRQNDGYSFGEYARF